MGDQCTAARTGVQVGAETRRATQIFGHGSGARIGCIHFAAQALEFGQGQVAGAARGGGRLDEIAAGIELGRRKRNGTLRGQRRSEDVGRGVQVALRMPAHQLLVAGEGYVAFQDAGAHARTGFIGLLRVFGELQRRATMTNREIAPLERAFRARLQPGLERTRAHVIDQEEWPRPKLNVCVLAILEMPAHRVFIAGGHGERGQQDENNSEGKCYRIQAHDKLLLRLATIGSRLRWHIERTTMQRDTTRESFQACAGFVTN